VCVCGSGCVCEWGVGGKVFVCVYVCYLLTQRRLPPEAWLGCVHDMFRYGGRQKVCKYLMHVGYTCINHTCGSC